jgi:hypothetical protein
MSTFSKQVANAVRTNRAEVKRLALKANLLKHPEVKKSFEMLPPKVRKDATLAMSVFSNSVFINLHVFDLDSFKDKRFTSLLERFIDWEATTNDYTHHLPNKDVRFDKQCHDDKVGDFTISVQIMAYVKPDSPLCRIVTTGFTEEVVRKEVKQIVCA